jgi:hypothetical protein
MQQAEKFLQAIRRVALPPNELGTILCYTNIEKGFAPVHREQHEMKFLRCISWQTSHAFSHGVFSSRKFLA